MRVHAWIPSSAFSDPAETVVNLQAAGVHVANLMLNDFSDKREASEFETFNVDKIAAMAAACQAAGIEVHATTWIMPHDLFIDGMLEELPPLLARIGCTLLLLNAEGPWTHAEGEFEYEAAAEKLLDMFYQLGLTGIGSAPEELLSLARICAVWCPQSYATEGSQATPGGVVPYSISRWSDEFGNPSHGWIIGLAAYDQDTPAEASMQPPIDDVEASGLSEVCYWTINAISERTDVQTFVAGISKATSAAGIFPTLPIATMPKGVYSGQLCAAQSLLHHAWKIDTGPIDGLPGPRTIAAVKTFQSARGLLVTGSVDGGTWVELHRLPS